MAKKLKDIRKREDKKADIDFIEDRWKQYKDDCKDSKSFTERFSTLSKSDFFDAAEEYNIRKAYYHDFNAYSVERQKDYNLFKAYKFIASFSGEHGPFYELAPKCFKEADKRQSSYNGLMELYSFSKKTSAVKLQQDKAEKTNAIELENKAMLAQLRHDNEIFAGEFYEELKNDTSEIWLKDCNEWLVHAMSVVYLLFKIRGVTPTPEAEEELKYEILEKTLRELCVLNSKYPDDFESYVSSRIFANAAAIYLCFSSSMSYFVTEYREKLYNFFIPGRGKKDEKEWYYASSPEYYWSYFQKENLRELLYITACGPSNNVLNDFHVGKKLYALFEKEFKRAGVQEEDICYDNLKDDTAWREYVIRPHESFLFGGEKSPEKIIMPPLMEVFIDRTKKWKTAYENMEAQYSAKDLERNEDYLHMKWEYNASKLQVLLMDIKRATDIKRFSLMPKDEQQHIKNCYIPNLWKYQLGKYAKEWGDPDYRLANIPDPTNNDFFIHSDEAERRKREIANEMERINILLSNIGSYSPEYNENLPFTDSINARMWKHDDYNISRHSVCYDNGNNFAIKEFAEAIGITCNAFKRDLVRFDKDALEEVEEAVGYYHSSKEEKIKITQQKFITSPYADKLEKEFSDYMKKGVTTDTLKQVVDETAKKETMEENER